MCMYKMLESFARNDVNANRIDSAPFLSGRVFADRNNGFTASDEIDGRMGFSPENMETTRYRCIRSGR